MYAAQTSSASRAVRCASRHGRSAGMPRASIGLEQTSKSMT